MLSGEDEETRLVQPGEEVKELSQSYLELFGR